MELLIYLILFLLVLIVSSTTNKLLPFLPLPLVQILLGIVIGLFLPNTDFHLNTELFLALVIGPLLFRESEEADITAILKHWRIIVYLIFPVIFISTLSLGGLAHLLWPIFFGSVFPWRLAWLLGQPLALRTWLPLPPFRSALVFLSACPISLRVKDS